jgi:hypothetical protein
LSAQLACKALPSFLIFTSLLRYLLTSFFSKISRNHDARKGQHIDQRRMPSFHFKLNQHKGPATPLIRPCAIFGSCRADRNSSRRNTSSSRTSPTSPLTVPAEPPPPALAVSRARRSSKLQLLISPALAPQQLRQLYRVSDSSPLLPRSFLRTPWCHFQ